MKTILLVLTVVMAASCSTKPYMVGSNNNKCPCSSKPRRCGPATPAAVPYEETVAEPAPSGKSVRAVKSK
jgi:hypothetical protein